MAVWFCPQAFLVARVPPSHPLRLSPHTQEQSSPPLALQSPHSSTQPSCTLADIRIPGLSMNVQGCGMDCLCRSNSVLFCHRPDVSLLISPSVQEFLQMWEPLCSSNSPSRGVCPIPLSLFPFFFISSCLVMWRSFLSFLVSRVFC